MNLEEHLPRDNIPKLLHGLQVLEWLLWSKELNFLIDYDAQQETNHLVNIAINPCPSYGKSSTDMTPRPYSLNLIGIIQSINNRCLEVQVWNALPNLQNFKSTAIPLDNLDVNDTILYFRWILMHFPGCFDLVERLLFVHRCSVDALAWSSVMELSYAILSFWKRTWICHYRENSFIWNTSQRWIW